MPASCSRAEAASTWLEPRSLRGSPGDEVEGLGFQVEGLGFQVEGLEFQVEGLGFQVEG